MMNSRIFYLRNSGQCYAGRKIGSARGKAMVVFRLLNTFQLTAGEEPSQSWNSQPPHLWKTQSMCYRTHWLVYIGPSIIFLDYQKLDRNKIQQYFSINLLCGTGQKKSYSAGLCLAVLRYPTSLFLDDALWYSLQHAQLVWEGEDVFLHGRELWLSRLHHVRSAHVVKGIGHAAYQTRTLLLVSRKLLQKTTEDQSIKVLTSGIIGLFTVCCNLSTSRATNILKYSERTVVSREIICRVSWLVHLLNGILYLWMIY